MPSTRNAAIDTDLARAKGERAVILFTPQVLSRERITAGVVVRLESGECAMRVAIPQREVEHAFGNVGIELYSVAHHLCQSLYEHVQAGHKFKSWTPPFAGAELGKVGEAEARDITSLLTLGLAHNSMLNTLLSNYEIPAANGNNSVVEKVRRAIKQNRKTEHLGPRFNQHVALGTEAVPMKVEFLGANYVAYFMQIPKTERGLEASTGRAHGKLFELQSLRRHFTDKPFFTPFTDERPNQFELLVVGDKSDPVQRRAWLQIETLADANEMITRLIPDTDTAANEVAKRELIRA